MMERSPADIDSAHVGVYKKLVSRIIRKKKKTQIFQLHLFR